jgi:FMN-dependent NADH-azoreductase
MDRIGSMTDVLLQIDSSPRRGSATRQLTAAFTDAWLAAHPDGVVRHHDLPLLNLPHLTATEMGAWFDDPAEHTNLHHLVLARSNELIDDVLAADELVIGAPMWNFSVPSSLKAWIDHIVRAGRTIHYRADGIDGAVTARRAVVVSSSGSDYGPGSPLEHLNMVGPYLDQILRFIGIGDVRNVHVNRQGPTWPDAGETLAQARSSVERLAANLSVAA